MYEFYEEPRRLNKKKVIIFSVICVAILLGIILLIARKISTPKNNPENPVVQENNTVIFSSKDNSVSVELSKNLDLTKYDSDYLLDLRSKDDLNIFIAKKDKVANRELMDIVKADHVAFLQNFEGYSNPSDIKELSVNNNLAYTYSFHYLDTNLSEAFYLQVVWLEVNESYYVFDIEFPLNELNFYTNLVTSLLASFQVK